MPLGFTRTPCFRARMGVFIATGIVGAHKRRASPSSAPGLQRGSRQLARLEGALLAM
jgi:hypothetical protein